METHIKGNQTTTVSGECQITSPKKITLHGGNGTIEISPSAITIEGPFIKMGDVESVS